MGIVEVLIVVGFFVVLIALGLGHKGSEGGRREGGFSIFRPHDPDDLHDAGNQLRFVEGADFKPRKLMGKEEFYTFISLQKWQKRNGPADCRLFAQVSYGEFLELKDRKAHSSINSKRADFLFIEKFGEPMMVVEYQGAGHWKGNAVLRDRVKSRALEKAGIPFVEIFPKDDERTIFGKLDSARDLWKVQAERRFVRSG